MKYPSRLITPDAAFKLAVAVRLWEAATPIEGTAAEDYLNRSCGGAPPGSDCLRFLPRAPVRPYWRSGGGSAPAIIANIVDANGAQIGSYLTYLPKRGVVARHYTGEIIGGRILLGQMGKAIVVADTIEAALMAASATGLPSVATMIPGNLAKFRPPLSVRRVVITHSDDAKAERAAGRLQRSLVGPRVRAEVLASMSMAKRATPQRTQAPACAREADLRSRHRHRL